MLGYVLMMFIVPEAKTPEERAVAGGLPFNAKEVIDRAKKQYAEGTRHWRRHWRQQQRHWRRYGPAGAAFPYGPTPALLVLLPVLALVHLALFVTMMAMMISLVNTGTILSWHLPADVPPWAGVLILLASYQVVVSPIRAANWWSLHSQPAGRRSGSRSGTPSSGWSGWRPSCGLPPITSRRSASSSNGFRTWPGSSSMRFAMSSRGDAVEGSATLAKQTERCRAVDRGAGEGGLAAP